MEFWRLLAHNHWFTLNLHGYKLRLCARCSGYLLGFNTSLLISDHLAVPLGHFDPRVQQLACTLLAFPYTMDWVTQSWGFRQSNNWVRLATGILLGVSIFIFSGLGFHAGRIIFIRAALAVAFIGCFGKLKPLY